MIRPVVIALGVALACSSASQAQMVVFDARNYASNLEQSARALEQINNQVRSLENQAQSLVNQARNLTSLPFSALQTVQANLNGITSLTQQAQRLAFDVQSMQREFSTNYTVVPGSSSAVLVAQANARWANSSAAFQQALSLQAAAVSGLPGSSSQTTALLSASQSATGLLQAVQAGNQLLALQNEKLSALLAIVAAQGRATVLQQANGAATQDQAGVEFQQFNSTGQGYQPYSAEMFH